MIETFPHMLLHCNTPTPGSCSCRCASGYRLMPPSEPKRRVAFHCETAAGLPLNKAAVQQTALPALHLLVLIHACQERAVCTLCLHLTFNQM